ncbi:BTB/POZ domain-containing protein-like [Iris pallida]|uniref:BTB/POZ domain-containing protein-like n=1 Tax=Iris pallida TaxID=29817 RepID=A0AAX6FYL4_IRIPA|nr:BTB/POZ domain-containing protein-like [Iris pallida]
MKFMKLGSRPDTFFTTEATRSVSSEVSTDIKIQVQNSLYLLHKFPLLSKCSRLQALCSKWKDSRETITIELHDIPGGADAFEVCAKFCYGITVTLSALNFVPVYCAACYLQMNDEADGGNLVGKLDAFLGSCVLRRWKDALVALQGTARYAPLCEELGVTSRCVDALASKVLASPSRAEWAGSHRGWWAEDVSELGVDLYWRIMLAVKSAGTVPGRIVGEAIQAYACRWLPSVSRDGYQCNETLDKPPCSDSLRDVPKKHRLLLEKLVSLLPSEKGASSCSFLLRLLRAANVLNASQSTKMELARRVGVQLEEATVADLLIPSLSYADDTLYDVDIVMTILEEFMLQGQSPPTSPPRGKHGYERRRSRSAENVEFEGQENSRRSSSASHSSKLRVAKLIDRYLQEIARDANLPMEKVIALAEAVPDFSRPDHDDLYKVIDTYLRAHPDLDKSARKRLCRVLNCKKLSMEACMHAAQNEHLPLRVVVQVLFFEQARAAASGGQVTELPGNIRALLATTSGMHHDDKEAARFAHMGSGDPFGDGWRSVSGLKYPEQKLATLRMKLAEDNNNNDDVDEEILNREGLLRSSSSRFKALCSIPTKPKSILNKLWSMNRSVRERH